MTLLRREGVALLLALGAILGVAAEGRGQGQEMGWDFIETTQHGDYREAVLSGNVRLRLGNMVVRADRAVLRGDLDELDRLQTSNDESDSELPRRDIAQPATRRRVTEQELQRRANSFVRAVQGQHARPIHPSSLPIGLLNTIYLEGAVVVWQQNREVARADSIYFSALEDRVILRNGELRLWATKPGQARVFVIRGDQLVRQGARTTGSNVSMTTCIAGAPHVEVLLSDIEIIERGDDFEVRTHDGRIAFAGHGIAPLPNTRFFTREQTYLPVQGASVGYSNLEGAKGEINLGGSFNEVGGAIHRYLTGRPESEFRGDWHLGLGYNQSRGAPLEGDLVYEVPDRYRGHLSGFFLSDEGTVLREIRRNLDGTPIDNRDRDSVQTENRFYLGDRTTLDLSVFHASDAAVRPEFYPSEYRNDERPETSAHLRHWWDNKLVTVTARANLADFSYADDRSLANSFREELPYATFHMFSEPVSELPNGTPVLLTSSGSAGVLRNDVNDGGTGLDNQTVRVDEELELSTPFWIGPVGVRPFVSARATYFDETVMQNNRTRLALAGGVRAATHLSRTWTWLDGNGETHGLRHVVSPAISFLDQFLVNGDPSDFRQIDAVDSLSENVAIRFELLNRLQRRDGDQDIREFLWLDLAQTVTPIAGRDNNGHRLGLFEYEIITTLPDHWLPLPNWRFVFEGEHDWARGDERTFNSGTRFGPFLGLNMSAEFRTDRNTDGTILYSASSRLLDRWLLSASSEYDLRLAETTSYAVNWIRNDHDWRFTFGVVFDNVNDETVFVVNFEPTVGGLFKPRNRQFVGGSILTDADGSGY